MYPANSEPRVAAMQCIVLVLGAVLLLAPTAGADPQRDDWPRGLLASGQRVEIKGSLKRDGSIEARRIRLRDQDEVCRIEGRIAAIDPLRRRLTIDGFEISLASAPAVFEDGRRSSLRRLSVGQIVQALGFWSGRTLHAARLTILEADSNREESRDGIEIEADIEYAHPATGLLVVLGRAVRLSSRARVMDYRTSTWYRNNRLRREDDDQQVPPVRIGEWLVVGGRVGGNLRNERDFRREPLEGAPDDRATTSAELLASAAFGAKLELYAKVRTSRVFELTDESVGVSDGFNKQIAEAYLSIDRLADGPVKLQIGRQRFRDGREWFIDEYLDAAHISLDLSAWRVEAAVAEGVFAGPPETRRRRDQRHAIGSLTRQFGARTSATGFIIARDDRNRLERPVWLGGSVAGRASRTLKYWGNGAFRRGRAAEIRLRGWAVDSGVAYRIPMPGQLALSGGYALASGDTSRSNGIDDNFRQTGLQDNRARFHGLKRFASYGEVFDPELSNLEILTMGVGFKPLSRASIDVVYHRYEQRVPRRSISSNALAARATGVSAELGRELDVIVSIQQIRRLDLSLVAGIFQPGPGLASPVRQVVTWRPEIRFFF